MNLTIANVRWVIVGLVFVGVFCGGCMLRNTTVDSKGLQKSVGIKLMELN